MHQSTIIECQNELLTIPEGVDACPSNTTHRPRLDSSGEFQVPLIRGDHGIGLLEVGVGWDHSILQTKDRLDEACDTSSTLDMADVTFHGTDDKRTIGRVVFGEDIGDSTGLISRLVSKRIVCLCYRSTRWSVPSHFTAV